MLRRAFLLAFPLETRRNVIALAAQFTPLMQRPQRAYSYEVPDGAAADFRSGASRQSPVQHTTGTLQPSLHSDFLQEHMPEKNGS